MSDELLLDWQYLTIFKQHNAKFSHIKADMSIRFMCDKVSKGRSNNTMPCLVVLSVKLLFDVFSNFAFLLTSFHSIKPTVETVLLHVLWHIWLYHCLIRHPENKRKLSKTDKYFIITDKSLLKRNGTYQSIYMFYLIFSVWRGELVGFVPSIIMWPP